MFGQQPGGYGGRPPPDPRNALALVLGALVTFFVLPWWMELTGDAATRFIESKYDPAWSGVLGGVYYVLSAFVLFQLSRLTIWFGVGLLVAGIARMMARTGALGPAF